MSIEGTTKLQQVCYTCLLYTASDVLHVQWTCNTITARVWYLWAIYGFRRIACAMTMQCHIRLPTLRYVEHLPQRVGPTGCSTFQFELYVNRKFNYFIVNSMEMQSCTSVHQWTVIVSSMQLHRYTSLQHCNCIVIPMALQSYTSLYQCTFIVISM